ncbi:hypothetical protein BX285_4238 [Streptomyces sp. 1114.5]|nr:hypothetical protein BX285_4238 [Streptomyces sp. 1114.5]SOB85967.1 hypothetical protein SAMN06272789_6269 [Streptomyces sp. 1331.2]
MPSTEAHDGYAAGRPAWTPEAGRHPPADPGEGDRAGSQEAFGGRTTAEPRARSTEQGTGLPPTGHALTGTRPAQGGRHQPLDLVRLRLPFAHQPVEDQTVHAGE